MDSQNQNIRRVFEEGFCARDIARSLRSFDAETPLDRASLAMKRHNLTVAAVRTDGHVSGYIQIDSLVGQNCGDSQRAFDPRQLVCGTLPLAQLVLRLHEHPYCFISAWEQACGYVGRIDLHKPPARMWLFGIVTLIEMRFGRLIEKYCSDEGWRAYMSPGRIQKAEMLHADRLRSGQQIHLVDCLQLADKAQIVARVETLRSMTRFTSRRQIEEIGRRIEKLRNNLAHSQDIVTGDWETIVTLAENVGSILDGPSNDGIIDS